MTNSRRRRLINQLYYKEKKTKILADRKASYYNSPETKKLASSDSYKKNSKSIKRAARAKYSLNPDKKKEAARAWSKANYLVNADQKKQAARAWSRANYLINADQKKQASRDRYNANPLSKKMASRFNYWKNQKKKAKKKTAALCKVQVTALHAEKARYSLKELKAHIKLMYVNQLRLQLLPNSDTRRL